MVLKYNSMLYLNKILWIPMVLLFSCQEEKKIQIDLNHTPNRIEIFGEDFISTSLYERDIAISPDGNEIIYTLGNYKQTIRSLISIKKEGNGWGEKQILPFSGRYSDIEPFFSPDGNRLYFASNRPMDQDSTRNDYNIWLSERTNSDWDDPQPLDTLINTAKDEFYPALSKNGNLYFTATRKNGIGREDIFISTFARGKYQDPVPLDTTINSLAFEFNAYINPDEDLLIFSSFGRKDGLGGGDLYFSKKDESGQWREAKNMGEEINSDKLDYCPFVDIPRGNFYFTSDRAKPLDKKISSVSEFIDESNQVTNGMGNIYRIHMEKLNLK